MQNNLLKIRKKMYKENSSLFNEDKLKMFNIFCDYVNKYIKYFIKNYLSGLYESIDRKVEKYDKMAIKIKELDERFHHYSEGVQKVYQEFEKLKNKKNNE